LATRARHKIYGLKPDVDYELQMSAVVNGIEGPKSARFKFRTVIDEVAPGPVQNLEIEYLNGVLILSWDPPAANEDGSDFTDFFVYFVEVTDNSSGEVTEFDTTDVRVEFSLQFLRWLFDGELSGDYTFTVYAADKAENRSEPASVTFSAEPPAPFNMLTWEGGNQSITVYWEESVDIDLTHYEIYRNGVLVGRTIGTETEFTDGNPGSGEHSYYAIAYDAFGLSTQSTNTLTGAKAYGYWQGDFSIPKPPTNVNFSSEVSSSDGALVDVTVSFLAPVANEDDSEYVDHNEFIIQWSKSTSGPWQTLRIADDRAQGTDSQMFEIALNDLVSSTVYHFRVAAVDRYSNTSSYINESHTTASDANAPSQPAAPTAAGGLLRVQVTHDMTKQGGGLLEEDVRELKVYIDTTSGFSPSASNYVGAISTLKASSGFQPNGSFPVESIDRRYVKVVAVDAAGNESSPSTSANSSDIELIQDQYIENASITNASIANLSAAKLIAGTAFVNDLGVESLLTVQSGGIVQSSNYVTNLSGWRLSDQGLEINNGTVAASALTINNSPNLLPWAYASFEQDTAQLFGGTDAGGNAIPAQTVFTANANTSSVAVVAWEGERSLRFRSAAGTSSGSPAEILFTPSTSTYRINVEASARYIYSFYARSSSSYAVRMVARWQGSATTESVNEVVVPNTSGKWQRFISVFTAPSGATGMYVGVRTISPNVDVYIDAQQVELVTSSAASSLLVASAWKSPTMTTIDGGMIRTGEIKSTNYTASTGWRIGLEGNLTAYNAFLRGTIQAEGGYLQNMSIYQTLTVGSWASDTTSRIQSYNGNWYIRGDGYLYAANASIAGAITATSGSFSGVNTYSMTVGGPGGSGYIQSSNYTGVGGTGWTINNASSGYTAVFNNVYVRGYLHADDIQAGSISGTRVSGGTIEGSTLRVPATPASIYGQIEIKGYTSGSGFAAGYGIRWINSSGTYVGSSYATGNDIFLSAIGNVTGERFKISELSSINSDPTGIYVNAYLNLGSGRRITSQGSYVEFNKAIELNNNTINGVNVIYANAFGSSGMYWGTYGHMTSDPQGSTDPFIRSTHSSGPGIKFSPLGELRVLNYVGSAYVPVRASSFPTGSSRERKSAIRDVKSATDVLMRFRPRLYNHQDITHGELNAGFVAEELADAGMQFVTSDKEAVDTYAVLAYAVKAIQELVTRVKALEARQKPSDKF
jgi:hypothetical protein